MTIEKDDKFEYEVEGAENLKDQIEVEDDTPPDDKNRNPMPKELVDELEKDDLEEYSEKVKIRLKQMKKVWHDERREKERALREQNEAIELAKRVLQENNKLKNTLSKGEKTLVDTYKHAVELQLDAAKKVYKEAYESGDSDRVLEAQQALTAAQMNFEKTKSFNSALQEPENEVTVDATEVVNTPSAPKVDPKTVAWQERNKWWGDPDYADMTALALGHHQKLENKYGAKFIGTEEYWQDIDETMRKRFPEYEWGDEADSTTSRGGKPATRTISKSANVVAPASRSTAPKKIVLKQSQVNIAKKLGLTPEQYAKEVMKLENQNGR